VIGPRVDNDPLADLDRRVGHQGENLRVPVTALQVPEFRASEDAHHDLRAVANLVSHLVKLVGLVTEHDEVGALGQFAVAGDAFAAQLIDQCLGVTRAAVGAEHRLTPATRHRAGHVSRADESDLHRR
jgi:hypothetical protein